MLRLPPDAAGRFTLAQLNMMLRAEYLRRTPARKPFSQLPVREQRAALADAWATEVKKRKCGRPHHWRL